MRYLIIALMFLESTALASPKLPEPEMIQGMPKQHYSTISPISTDKKTQEQAFAELKKKGQKLGADAIIQWSCASGATIKPSGLDGAFSGIFGGGTNVNSTCQGIAIKWD